MKLKSLLSNILFLSSMLCVAKANATSCDSIGTAIHKGKSSIKYKVDKGNTFYSISKKYGVTVDELMSFNEIKSLGLNQIIYIPTNKVAVSNQQKHIVAKGETLYMISKKYNVTVEELKKRNKLSSNELSLGQTLNIDSPKSITTKNIVAKSTPVKSDLRTHQVAKGETLYSISKIYDISVSEIKLLNKLTNNELNLGQQLILSKNSPVNTSKEIQKEAHLINSKSNKLDGEYCEILCAYGDKGDVIKIMYNGKTCYARIVGTSDDTHIYASQKIFTKLNINQFSTNVTIQYFNNN